MDWDEVHYYIEQAPFCKKRLRIAYDFFCYKDDDLSSMDLGEIFNLDPDVLEQLLEQPMQEEEPPQHNLVDVGIQNMSLEAELEEIDPEELRDLMVEYLLTNPENLVQVEEEIKKVYPAILEEITKNKRAILPPRRKLLHQARNRNWTRNNSY